MAKPSFLKRGTRELKRFARSFVQPLIMLSLVAGFYIYENSNLTMGELIEADTPSSEGSIIGRPSVTDGDTLKINGERIRLHGIDAPESEQTCSQNGSEWDCGSEATKALTKKIDGNSVRCEGDTRDRYGRLIAVCYRDGEDLNAWMVEHGWAMAYRRYSKAYVRREGTAESRGVGIWVGEFTPPWEWRKLNR